MKKFIIKWMKKEFGLETIQERKLRMEWEQFLISIWNRTDA